MYNITNIVDSESVMCEHEYQVEGEVMQILFDENDVADTVAKPVWMCYDCHQVIADLLEGENNVLAA